ncbi:MAG: DinB family protein [Nitrospinaceae bacterium]|jgi:hypothetical protein|nr:DinB family protein [Nitrospinaceae bacterium]MBT3435922.1 DinB family protein [Nitrospinaceae bacterium]MBT3821602.1 DinB family protein [Nitrospinaceae bacterium]MBT4094531.1 DinB family protein [Nitrospinaceae bacterium]MBT4432094.1 DinB family protein [Nitrospinaceae bacterium]
MNATTIILGRLDAYAGQMKNVMEEITEEDLYFQAGTEDNPIGWLTWHMTRYEDLVFSHISDRPQIWIGEGWHEKFSRPATPEDTGAGHTIEQVKNFRATKETLIDYAAAVRLKTKHCLSDLTDFNLDAQVDDFGRGSNVAVGEVLGRFFGDHISHVGQICYIRGHLKGWGKYGR